MRTPLRTHPSFLASCFRYLLGGALGLAFASFASAQCATQWVQGPSGCNVRGIAGVGYAVTPWDPDGAGPQPVVLVIGGEFSVAGTVMANNVATYDPATGAWASLGSGTNGNVLALATLPNGQLVAAGDFTTAGGTGANRIAAWDGTAWSPLGVGTNGLVRAMKVLANGHLVAGGDFDQAGGATANRIARWDGASWLPLGTGIGTATPDRVAALAVLANGDLVAGGGFWVAGGVNVNNIARWNGTSWAPLGVGIVSGEVLALATLSNGQLIAGGALSLSGSSNIVRWTGTSWTSVAGGASTNGLNGTVRSLVPLANGQFYAGGEFTNPTSQPGLSLGGVARWPGSGGNWAAVGAGVDYRVDAMTTLPSGVLWVTGTFNRAGTMEGSNLAGWNGTSWSTPPGISIVKDVAVRGNGDIVVVGLFSAVGSVNAQNVAVWNGSNWAPMGSGIVAAYGSVKAVCVMPNGDIIAGEQHFPASGSDVVKRWNGTAWSPVGTLRGSVYALAVMPNGDLVAGGRFFAVGVTGDYGVARWDGASWNLMLPVGSSGTGFDHNVSSLVVMPSGELVAGGFFFGAPAPYPFLAKWDGTSWSGLGAPPDGSVASLVVLRSGGLVAYGQFTNIGGVGANHIARWNGSSWSALGAGMDAGSWNDGDQLELPNGDLLVAGMFEQAGGAAALRVARWNGTAWSAVDQGLSGMPLCLAELPGGDIMVGGILARAGSVASAGLARLTTTCPATATALGAGCTGSGGLNTLTATSLPWLGSSFQLRATGFPPNSLGFGLLGITPTSIPVVAVHPAGLPGCTLYTLGDVQADFLFPSAGAANIGYSIPMDPFLVGLVAHAQMASVELDLAANITAISTTNEVQFTLGQF